MRCVDVVIPPDVLFCGLVESWPSVAPCCCLPNLLRLSEFKLLVQRARVGRRFRGTTLCRFQLLMSIFWMLYMAFLNW